MTMHQTLPPADGEAQPGVSAPVRKVLFFGKNMARTRATGGLVGALRGEGLAVKWLNKATLRRWLGRARADRFMRRAFREFQPDLVFVFCRDLPFSLLEEFSQTTRTVVWVEEPLEYLTPDYVDYLAQAHAVFMTNPSKVSWLRSRDLDHVSFLLEGYSSKYHYPVPERPAERDVVFIGGPGQRGQRAEFLAEIAEEFDVEVFGNHWESLRSRYPRLRMHGPIKYPKYRELCASSRIVLGLNQINSDSLYFSNRTFLTLGCRGFHLTHYVPGLEAVFEDDVHLAWYRDREECVGKIRSYLADDSKRSAIADAGYRLTTEHHQYSCRVREMLQMLAEGRRCLAEPEFVSSRILQLVRLDAVRSASE